MLDGLNGRFAKQICDGGVEQPRDDVHHGQWGKDVAGLVARHGQGVDFEVLGELFLCQTNGPTAVSDVATQALGQRPTYGLCHVLSPLQIKVMIAFFDNNDRRRVNAMRWCPCKGQQSSCFYGVFVMMQNATSLVDAKRIASARQGKA